MPGFPTRSRPRSADCGPDGLVAQRPPTLQPFSNCRRSRLFLVAAAACHMSIACLVQTGTVTVGAIPFRPVCKRPAAVLLNSPICENLASDLLRVDSRCSIVPSSRRALGTCQVARQIKTIKKPQNFPRSDFQIDESSCPRLRSVYVTARSENRSSYLKAMSTGGQGRQCKSLEGCSFTTASKRRHWQHVRSFLLRCPQTR